MGVKAKVTGGVFAGLVVGVLAGAVGVAWLYPPVDTSPIDNATKAVAVTAQVEDRPVRDLFSMSAQVTSETVEPVMPTSGGEGARQVVSGKVHAIGDVLHYGDVVAEVSGRPIFAVPASLPLYRDIRDDSKGSDVAGLQQMLTDIGLYSGSVAGEIGPLTLQAIAKLYTRAGYLAPDPKGLAMGDTAAVPSDAVTVASAAEAGSVISEDNPLVTVVTAPAVITARADMIQIQGFPAGATVNVQIGSASPVPSTVTSVGDFQESTFSQPPGYDVTIAIPEGVDPVAIAQEPVIVSESGQVPTGPSVPLTAIRRDGSGSFVLLPSDSTSTPGVPRTVAVTVVGQSSGYAVIQDNPDLPVGTTILVSGD